jgi:hypothetical protein
MTGVGHFLGVTFAVLVAVGAVAVGGSLIVLVVLELWQAAL